MTIARYLSALALSLLIVAGLAGPATADAVRVTVNDQAITDVQISQRAKLFELERRGGTNSERLRMAQEELINEQLQVQEAARLGITVTDAQISSAYLNVARNLKVSEDNLNTILNQNGVNSATLKARLKAAIAWQGVTRAAISGRVQVSDLELEQKAQSELTTALSYDYILKEIRFIGGNASGRTADANRYRSKFTGCDGAVQLSLNYTDAAVLDVGRRHATQLPDAIAGELAGLNVGGITKPRVVEGGVSMMAICAKATAEDTTFLKNQLRQESGTELLKAEADAYLDRLRRQARIIRL
jgi:peptidyl-prolyl cis-trans isomerase SurA